MLRPRDRRKVEDDNPQTIWSKSFAAHAGRTVVSGFKVVRPDNLTWPEILQNLKGQSYVRVLVPARDTDALTLARIEDLLGAPKPLAKVPHLFVAQDRIAVVVPGIDAARSRAAATDGVLRLLSVGAIVPRKGFDVLVDPQGDQLKVLASPTLVA